MKQDKFESRHKETWKTFDDWIQTLSRGGKHAAIGKRFPAMYRQICHHLAIARARRYSVNLQQRLNQLALDGHHHLYKSRVPVLSLLLQFVAQAFPCTFRRKWKYMLTSGLVLYLPGVLMAFAVTIKPELIFSVLDPVDVARMEEMYDPENDVFGRERESDSDIYMFGMYIYNNISIGFRTFASGLLFGLGSLFFLAFNGVVIGSIAGHLTALQFGETFWSFVAGHSSFELTAIVIFGGVGLMLGHGAVAPGRRTRWQAIRKHAIDGMPLVYGGTAMLVIAAFVEAFWSSTAWPPAYVKYAVGIAFWVVVGLYFGLMGRNES